MYSTLFMPIKVLKVRTNLLVMRMSHMYNNYYVEVDMLEYWTYIN